MTSEVTMNKMKAQRGGIKTSITKLFTKIDDALTNKDTDYLETALVQLSEKEKQIIELDKLIQDEYQDLKLLETEVELAQDYRDKLISYKMKINKALKDVPKTEINVEMENSNRNDMRNMRVISDHISRVKLPKINIEKFDGNTENFQEFWSQYKSAIHNSDNLSKIDKFTYLKSLLRSSAQNAIQGLSMTEENYDAAIKIIEDRYGRKEILIRSHINKLLNLSPVKSASNLNDLRVLHDTCEIQIRGLKSLNIELDSYGNFLFPIITKLIPDSLILNYNREYKDEAESWNVVQLLDYLKSEIQIRERTQLFQKKESDHCFRYGTKNKTETETVDHGKNYFGKKKFDRQPSAAALNAASINECLFCSNNDHKIEECTLSVAEKKSNLLRQGRCFNCLRKFHVMRNCVYKPACTKCKKKHNQYICDENTKPKVESNETVVSSVTENKNTRHEILLQTATVLAESKNKKAEVRCLLDLGSQRSFIAIELANELNLKVVGKELIKICPFGSKSPKREIIDRVQINLRNINDPSKRISIQALTTETISDAIIYRPGKEIREMCKINNLTLADAFSSPDTPKVKLLIGADFYWDIMNGNIQRFPSGFVGMNSLFGYVISGSSSLLSDTTAANESETKMMNLCAEKSADVCLEKFWQLDAIGILEEKKELSNDEQGDFLEEFEKNIKFENNRYTVKLPWNENVEKLENNYDIAKYRLRKLVKKFEKDCSFYERYNTVISKQISDGIVEEVDLKKKPETNVDREYYMPHQAVIREDKTTTKLRVVFDASSHASNTLSLNDCLHSGPNLNPDTLALLLKFRNKPFAFTADIEQAFLQIALDQEDRNAVRFLWIEDDYDNQNYKTRILRMTRVLFGATSSPFLLSATLKHHVKKYEHEYPLAFQILNSQLYVDDLISGLDSEYDVWEMYQQIKKIMHEGGFNMRKWRTNSETLQIKLNETENCHKDLDDCSKVLGYIWNSNDDTLRLESEFVKSNGNLNVSRLLTKRIILKIASKIYDPIGFITPFTLIPKILLQNIWDRKLKWDDPLPTDLRKEWLNWCDELEHLSKIKISRYIFEATDNTNELQFHCFVDASKKAYGAVLYVRYTDSGKAKTSFVCSKSRVAPLQKLTLPRLELMAAVIGSRLFGYVRNYLLNGKDCDVRFWSDSMIVLHWVRSSKRLKTFVQNRVSEIRAKTDISSWSYCPGSENPSDLLTRGANLRSIQDSEIWWHGPKWLSESEDCWPNERQEDFDTVTNDEEIQSAIFIVEAETEAIINIEKFGKLSKLLRITAWITRFISNLKTTENRKFGALTSEELRSAETYWIQRTQKEHFKEELESLKCKREIPPTSKLKNFKVKIDSENIVRLISRLQYADITYSETFPILLPDRSQFTDLVIRNSHERTAHAGIAETLTDVREKFWIIRGRQRIKTLIYNCNLCKKFRVKHLTQEEAPLPPDRIKQTHPFEVSGIDYAGPLYVKYADDTKKAYILLFTCAVTRAVHLELTEDLTTKTFLLAFRKFIARRGLCRKIYSDNARTFKKANTELNILWKYLKEEEIQNYFATKNIEWKFIVERAAWWGGFWERLIRSTKNCLKRMLGKSSLTFPELETAVIEVEAILNSRPLTFVYNDCMEPEPLTPGHFVIGRRLISLPPNSSLSPDVKPNARRMWKHKQLLMERLWKKWRSSYLLDLRSAHQSSQVKGKPNLTKDSVVLVHDAKLPRLMWRMGIVVSIHSGRDGKVRACTIRLSNGTLIKRPVQLLYPVELPDSNGPNVCQSNGLLGPEDDSD